MNINYTYFLLGIYDLNIRKSLLYKKILKLYIIGYHITNVCAYFMFKLYVRVILAYNLRIFGEFSVSELVVSQLKKLK